MAIKRYKPTSAARRFMTVHTYEEITETKPERSLVEDMRKTGGRNNQGKITVRHIGGGNRRKYRIIDFKRNKDGVPATVKSIQYDPNRSANIALLAYADGEKRYILAPVGLNVGDTVLSGKDADIKGGQLPAARKHPRRHDGAQHRAQARPRRPDRPRSRHQRAADGRVKARTRPSRCPAAKCASSPPSAARPSARSATSSTRSSASAKRARPATWAPVRRCAARS